MYNFIFDLTKTDDRGVLKFDDMRYTICEIGVDSQPSCPKIYTKRSCRLQRSLWENQSIFLEYFNNNLLVIENFRARVGLGD